VATIDQPIVRLFVFGLVGDVDLRLVRRGAAGFRGNPVSIGAVPAFPALVHA
jgi:hypothetical protein